MTLRCNVCNGIVGLIGSNDAEYPEPRIERYECEECGHRQTEVLTA